VQQIVEHAQVEDPNECCGILAGTDGSAKHAYRITNTVKSPYRYLMDPQQFLDADKDSEARGWKFLAFYHSHTHSEAYPSQTDVRMALESGWLDVHYVLVSLADKAKPVLQAFHIHEDGKITEDTLQVG
jgi:proteasome lid subunit RPN8/RPN11